MKISAVLITKNEQKVIARCLMSLYGFDEVIVLDTGSADRTMKIARQLGATVLGPDPIKPFHFAEARNRALDCATGDFVLSIDADEILRKGSLVAIKETVSKNPFVDIYQISFVQRPYKNAVPIHEWKGRFFRRGSFRWKFRVHELVFPTVSGVNRGRIEDCVIEHFPETDKKARHRQNLELLEMSVSENPEHGWGWRELGMEYLTAERYADAIDPLEKYLSQDWPHLPPGPMEKLIKSQDMLQLGRCFAKVGRLPDALPWFEASHRHAPERREPLYHAALELMKAKMPWEAEKYFERLLAIPIDQKPQFHLNDPVAWGTLMEEGLALCRAEIAKAKALENVKP